MPEQKHKQILSWQLYLNVLGSTLSFVLTEHAAVVKDKNVIMRSSSTLNSNYFYLRAGVDPEARA